MYSSDLTCDPTSFMALIAPHERAASTNPLARSSLACFFRRPCCPESEEGRARFFDGRGIGLATFATPGSWSSDSPRRSVSCVSAARPSPSLQTPGPPIRPTPSLSESCPSRKWRECSMVPPVVPSLSVANGSMSVGETNSCYSGRIWICCWTDGSRCS